MLCSAGFAITDGADAEKQIAVQIAKRRRFVIIRKPHLLRLEWYRYHLRFLLLSDFG